MNDEKAAGRQQWFNVQTIRDFAVGVFIAGATVGFVVGVFVMLAISAVSR